MISKTKMLDLVENAACFAVGSTPRTLVETANMGLVHVEQEWRFR